MKNRRSTQKLLHKGLSLPAVALGLSACVFISGWTAPWHRPKEHSLVQSGLERNYLVYTPRGAEQSTVKRPLVIVLHGGGGTHRGMVRLTKGRFNTLADQNGFYVVYPNAIDKTWDFGEGKVSEALPYRVDDLGYFEMLISELVRTLPVDPARIFATGISRGGQASYFLACKLPTRIRAIAPFTMPLPDYLEDDCRSGPPVGIALFNGTGDPLVPYDGGSIKVFRQDRGEVLSTAATLELWRRRNGCSDSPVSHDLIDPVPDNMQVEKTTFTNCSGAPVVLYRIENGGHTWPSGTQYLGKRLVGPVNKDIDGAVEAWKFFQQFD